MSTPFAQFSESAFQPQPPPRRSGMKTWLIVLLASGGAVACLLVACGGLMYLGATGISNREPTDAERAVLITADDLAPFGAQPSKHDQREVWNTKKNFDGTLEIEYDYDPELAPGDDDPLMVTSQVELAGSESDARESYAILLAAYQLGFRISGVKSREQSHQMAGVDQCHFSLILNGDGDPVGNMAVLRAGKRLHGLMIVGVYFDDPATLESLLRPTIERSAALSAR